METMARNQYLAGDNRDPTQCSLFYFALGKVKLVHGLWRQASWHKEQALMLKFLNNDFSQPRWRTAALKNAFALLSKQRFGTCFIRQSIFVCLTCLRRVRGGVLPTRRKPQGRRQCMHPKSVGLPARDSACACCRARRRRSCAQGHFDHHRHTHSLPRWQQIPGELGVLDLTPT